MRNLRVKVMFVTLLTIGRFMSRKASKKKKKTTKELSFIVKLKAIILIVVEAL